jgi:hypothetical protein
MTWAPCDPVIARERRAVIFLFGVDGAGDIHHGHPVAFRRWHPRPHERR